MKLVASAAALMLVGLSSIWLWQDAVTRPADSTPGVIITSQSAEPGITVAEGPGGGGGFGDVLGISVLGMELGGTGATDPASSATATAPDQLPVTEVWARFTGVGLAWEQAGADAKAQAAAEAAVRAEETAAAEESAAAAAQAEREAEQAAAAQAAEEARPPPPPPAQPVDPAPVDPVPADPGDDDDDDDDDDVDDDD